MPVEQCSSRGRPGYRWGKSGKCYVYNPNSTQSKVAARNKAEKQGRAVKANQGK